MRQCHILPSYIGLQLEKQMVQALVQVLVQALVQMSVHALVCNQCLLPWETMNIAMDL